MALTHKNKTFTTLLAFVLGGVGAHRFYLRGLRDKAGWLHLASLPACAAVALAAPGVDVFYKILPLIVSVLAACLEALVLGLMSDEKWDAAYNNGTGKQSDSTWPLALILVLTLAVGAGSMIATMSRLFDLLYTGGAYG